MGFLRRRARDFFTNWGESDDPVLTKLGKTVVNRTISTGRTLSGKGGCCGHYGEPGC